MTTAQGSLTQCPACTNVTLGLHCDTGPQSVTECDWRKCTDSKCQAQFDLVNGRGHRIAPERPMVKTKNGAEPVRVRMIYTEGGWRDDPRDGV